MNLSKSNTRKPENLETWCAKRGVGYRVACAARERGQLAINGRDDHGQPVVTLSGVTMDQLRAQSQGTPARHDEREYRPGDVPSVAPRDSRSEAQRVSLLARREPQRRQAHRQAVEQARAAQRPQPAPKTSAGTGAGYRQDRDGPSLAKRARQRREAA